MPLYLEIRLLSLKKSQLKNEITNEVLSERENELFDEWQQRYETLLKGSWTKKMVPSVRHRFNLPMQLDHYTT